MTSCANIHANCVVLDRAGEPFAAPRNTGVLILGQSGSGKSTLTLQLIAAGAKLVSDDRTELFPLRGELHARAPKQLEGMLEIRGVGIVKIAYCPSVRVRLAVMLISDEPPRLPDYAFYTPPAGLAVEQRPPLLNVKRTDISAVAKIAAAAAAFANEGIYDSPK